MKLNSFRECGDCHACCDGNLSGISYGNKFGNGKPCVFLVDEECVIYEDRPSCCVKYQCAWTQHILPLDMQPNKCGLMVSVEVDLKGKQYLKVMEMFPLIEYRYYKEILKFCEENDTYFVKVKYNEVE